MRQELLCSGRVWGNSSFEHTISYDETFWRKRIALRKCSEHKRVSCSPWNDFRRISFNHWFQLLHLWIACEAASDAFSDGWSSGQHIKSRSFPFKSRLSPQIIGKKLPFCSVAFFPPRGVRYLGICGDYHRKK